MKKILCLLLIIFIITACRGNGKRELGSGIGRACAGQFAGFLDGIERGSLCLCDGEIRGEFELGLGPVTLEAAHTIGIGKTTFGVEKKDESTISLFNVVLDSEGLLVIVGDPVGELQNLIEGTSSLEFVIQLGNDPQERVVCPACFSGPVPLDCDPNEEINKPKCLDRESLVDTGSSCPADSIARVCDPFFCSGELFNEETELGLAFDGAQLPSENSAALGCNTITDGSLTFSDIKNIPPGGKVTGPIPEDGMGEGGFGCSLEPFF